ncbi:MAG TPA: hypothetical protein PKU96_02340 [bacterium]|nr:hypothetical protein [Myxococcales bacterium]OQA62064.1 MAG: hypothetical protein BWY40_00316 [bacterium ADurb.Bin270]HPW45193.1 hypothetical protein [bacterium]HQC50896.1 hypothetical protein [bacterium]HQG13337.1 hypothetical protein [bacterium]
MVKKKKKVAKKKKVVKKKKKVAKKKKTVKKKKRVVKKKKATKRKVKRTSKRKGSKKAFGGYTINFKGCNDSVENVFGKTPIAPSAMTKKLWSYVKRKKLNKK